MIKRISRYLIFLGIYQLVFLSPIGLFWLFFANRIKSRINLFRKIVLGFHGFILFACLLGVICLLVYPTEENTTLTVYTKEFRIGQVGQILHIIIQAFIWSPPFFWLLREDVKVEFIQTSNQQVDPIVKAPAVGVEEQGTQDHP